MKATLSLPPWPWMLLAVVGIALLSTVLFGRLAPAPSREGAIAACQRWIDARNTRLGIRRDYRWSDADQIQVTDLGGDAWRVEIAVTWRHPMAALSTPYTCELMLTRRGWERQRRISLDQVLE